MTTRKTKIVETSGVEAEPERPSIRVRPLPKPVNPEETAEAGRPGIRKLEPHDFGAEVPHTPTVRLMTTEQLEHRVKHSDTLKFHADIVSTLGIYPLDAPGMPPPGNDLIAHAEALAGEESEDVRKTLIDLTRSVLRTPGFRMPVTIRKGVKAEVPFVPGHIWGQHRDAYAAGLNPDVDGPRPASVMIIGKMPGTNEVEGRRCFLSESADLLVGCMRDLQVKNMRSFYVTHLVKFQAPDGNTNIAKSWLNLCMPFLHQELRIVRPRYILCLGADASKALLGAKFGVNNMDGRIEEISYYLDPQMKEDPAQMLLHTSLVMTVVHPAQVVRAPDAIRQLERGLARFNLMINGVRFDKEEQDIDHRVVRTLEQLEDLLVEIDHDPDKHDNWISVDAEWHGEHPVNTGAYVRTIQIGWKPKHAAAIVLNAAGGGACFVDAEGQDATQRAIDRLNEFFTTKRVCGHFLVADLEWLTHLGLHEVLNAFRVPVYDIPFNDLDPDEQELYRSQGFSEGEMVPAWALTATRGGWDTGLAGHAIEETAQLGLEALSLRYTTAPRYDIPLDAWRERFCKEHGLKSKDLEGYGECPDDVLVPYGNYDADVTLRLMYAQQPLIDSDYNQNCCREPFWEAMITAPVLLEMHRTGISVDKQRIDQLTVAFMAARTAQEDKIRTWAAWPDFNIRSVQQVKEFLFGTRYNGTNRSNESGQWKQLRPEGGKTLDLKPILDTSKPPKPWNKVVEQGREAEASPGTGKTVLGVLATDNPVQFQQINWIRDYRFLDQVLKSILRPPKLDADGKEIRENADDTGDGGADNLGGLVYDAGLASVICDDGRVRTHLYPTTETGRCRSARPNLQNISKRRDGDYKRMLGDAYKHKLRSILRASPGHVLIEADYKSAELFGLAILTGDPKLLDHCMRNQLSESDPKFYDIHSNVAVRSFNLDCPPTKKGLASIGKVGMRVAAKNVIFGVAYGRGAKAIALQCREEGNPISVDDAQRIIDSLFNMYAGMLPFFEECRKRVREQRWICNSFGRLRRFPETTDRVLLGEFERQAMNFPIQSLVASTMDRAMAYLQDYRDNVLQDPGYFRILLQIHDALLLEAPYENATEVATHILPHCMTERVAIYPSNLAGIPLGTGPYHMGTDVEIFEAWGEPVRPEICEKYDIRLTH